MPVRDSALVGLLGLLLAIVPIHAAEAQITRDNSLTPASTLTGPNYVIDVVNPQTQIKGTNLFHSFGQFNVQTGESATFMGPNNITNILGRVTGGQSSFIDGAIAVSIPGANLFLMNPAGMMFGPNASLNLSGSFHATTADYIRLADNARFYANLAQNSVLTAASPVAFGFLGPAAGSITVEGSFLQVADGQTLSLVGRDAGDGASGVQLIGAGLTAVGGRIQIGSAGSAGELAVSDLSTLAPFSRMGNIDIVGSLIDVSGDPSGTVLIRGGQLVVDTGFISASNVDFDAPTGIDIALTGDMFVTNGTSIGTQTFGLGRGADVQISAANVLVDGSIITTFNFGDGRAGDINLNVNSLSVTGGGAVASAVQGFGPGGNVNVNAQSSVTIAGRDPFGTPATLSTEALLVGDGGRVQIIANSVVLDDGGTILSNAIGLGRGGDLAVTANTLSMTNAGRIVSQTGGGSAGGNVAVTVAGNAMIAGGMLDQFSTFTPSGIVSTSCLGCPSAAGDIVANFGALTLSDGAAIQSGSAINPQGGNVTVTVSDSLLVSQRAGISIQAQDFPIGRLQISGPSLTIDNAFISTSTVGIANAGDIVINAQSLHLRNGGQLTSSSEASSAGRGGNIMVNTTQSVAVSGSSPDNIPASPFSLDTSSGLFSTARDTGDAGRIDVTTPTLTVSDAGKISVATQGTGRAGDVVLNTGTLNVTGAGRIDSGTTSAGRGGTITANAGAVNVSGSGSALASNATSTGVGGDVNINASDVTLAGGGTISATSTGTGDAGNISIAASNALALNSASITTQATTADGGNIDIRANRLLRLGDSQITTAVESGFGAGGNIFIDPEFVVLNNSLISANAFGGPGGNVTIIADTFLSNASAVTASSALSTPGVIDIQARITNISESVAPLPEGLLQVASLLRAACAARITAGRASSLVVGARDAVPAEPGGLLESPILAEGAAVLGTRTSWNERIHWGDFQGLRLAAADDSCRR